jgi:glutaminase
MGLPSITEQSESPFVPTGHLQLNAELHASASQTNFGNRSIARLLQNYSGRRPAERSARRHSRR